MILYKKSVFTIIIIKSIVAFLKDTYSYFEKGSRIKCTHNRESIVGGFEFTDFQGNLKEWLERPWTYVCEC